MPNQKYKFAVSARVSFPYYFNGGIYETEEQARADNIQGIKESVCIDNQDNIEISDMKVERLKPATKEEVVFYFGEEAWED